MSKNTCPRCKGHSEYINVPEETSHFLCTGCEIKIYHELHAVMDQFDMTKEEAYQYLVDQKNQKNIKAQTDNPWIDVNKQLPPCNILVKVMLTNGVEALDFVNEPLNEQNPFQHYLVTNWKIPTTEELNEFMKKANR